MAHLNVDAVLALTDFVQLDFKLDDLLRGFPGRLVWLLGPLAVSQMQPILCMPSKPQSCNF